MRRTGGKPQAFLPVVIWLREMIVSKIGILRKIAIRSTVLQPPSMKGSPFTREPPYASRVFRSPPRSLGAVPPRMRSSWTV